MPRTPVTAPLASVATFVWREIVRLCARRVGLAMMQTLTSTAQQRVRAAWRVLSPVRSARRAIG